jgi:hypothetical protein
MNGALIWIGRRIAGCAGVFLMLVAANPASAQPRTNLNLQLVSTAKPATADLSYGDVWAEGDLACLGIWLGYAANNYGVGIYSISNPAAPVLLSVYSPAPTSQNQFELGALRNRIGYFGSWSGGGLHIVSLTNPATPVLLSRIGATTGTVTNGFDRVHTIFLERNFLYEAAHVAGIVSVKVFDVSNPFAPVYVRDIVTTNTTKVHQLTVQNKAGQVILYTSGWGGNDNANPLSPGQTDLWDVTQVGTQPALWLGRIYSGYNSHSSWPTPDGNTLVVCREIPGGDVRFYDISNPATIPTNAMPFVTLTPASMGLTPDIPHNPVVVGNFLFLSWYQSGLQIFDITDRTRPVRVGFYDTFPGAPTSNYQGNWGVFPDLGFDKILLSDIQRGLFVLNAQALLTPQNNYPPLIVQPPTSVTVTQGMNATFAPTITGSALAYQWRFNGANLLSATGATLTLSNVTGAAAGSYSVVVSNATGVVTSSVANLTVLFPVLVQTEFYEDFDAVTASERWDLFQGSANGVPDYAVDWSFDYSTYFSVFNGDFIPPAPNTTNGTTRGLRLQVNNNDAIAATAGVSLYPKNQSFSGAYKLKFDLWMNYPGTAGGAGSTGSTEHSTFGLNHTGTRVNWDSSTANPSDGVWFAVDGEGGVAEDYRAYQGNNASSPTLLSFANSGFSASGASSRNNTDSRWQTLFPAPFFETPGAPGKRWVQVEIGQDNNNVVTWRMNGELIAQRPNLSGFTNGNVMIGCMDLFPSIASPAADAFVLVDNVRVETSVAVAPPTITAQPQPAAAYPGADVMFSVAVTGSAPLTFQWRFNGNDIPGATNSAYGRAFVSGLDVGYYSVQVANPGGLVVSSNAVFTLLDSPYLSGVQATPGAYGALISWNTTVPAASQVQYDLAPMAGSFGSSSYVDAGLTTNHVILLTGLTPDTQYSFQVLATAGTNIYVSGVYQFTTAGSVILDNEQASYTGTWTAGTAALDKFGTNYQFASTVAGEPTATTTWRPQLVAVGKYDVYVWYSQGGNRASNAAYTIAYAGGSTNIFVNQQTGGGDWRLLASGLNFARGSNGFVQLANNAAASVVIADAVRFEYVAAQDLPGGSTVPAWWGNFFFPEPTLEPTADPDADGYTTAQEYVMGTVPTNAASHLQLSSEATNGMATITFWPYLGNRTYELLARPQLNTGSWQPVPAESLVPTPTGQGRYSFSPTNGPQSFYRLKVQMTTDAWFSGGLAVPAEQAISGFATEERCGPNRAYIVR